MVATDMSLVAVLPRCGLERSFALETRLGTSERSEELIYSSAPGKRAESKISMVFGPRGLDDCDVGRVSERAE